MYASQGEHSKALLTAETMLRGDGRVEHQAGKRGLNTSRASQENLQERLAWTWDSRKLPGVAARWAKEKWCVSETFTCAQYSMADSVALIPRIRPAFSPVLGIGIPNSPAFWS